MVMAAMARITPDTVMAASQGTSAVITFGGRDPQRGERYVSYESLKGGFGARPVKDGINAVASTVSNMMNTPIEILEMSFPLRVEEYALIPDSGGAGTWRGGLGARRVWRVLDHEAHAAVCCERSLMPPFGLAGGKAGGGMGVRVELPDGSSKRLNSKGAFRVPPGGRIVMEAPGSGGFGSSERRDPERLREDLADGYVSNEAARREYGAKP
jgi:N-methylhydantoinase B